MVDSIASKMSVLPDPYDDRAAKNVETPPNKPLENEYLYPYTGKTIYNHIAFRNERNSLHYYAFYSLIINDIVIGADANKPDWKLLK